MIDLENITAHYPMADDEHSNNNEAREREARNFFIKLRRKKYVSLFACFVHTYMFACVCSGLFVLVCCLFVCLPKSSVDYYYSYL